MNHEILIGSYRDPEFMACERIRIQLGSITNAPIYLDLLNVLGKNETYSLEMVV